MRIDSKNLYTLSVAIKTVFPIGFQVDSESHLPVPKDREFGELEFKKGRFPTGESAFFVPATFVFFVGIQIRIAANPG